MSDRGNNVMKDIQLIIGDKNFYSWSLCPWLLLNMFNLEFDEVKIPLFRENTAERLGPYSPSLKVPALIHGDVSVWDSLAICEYISENMLDDAGWPLTSKRKAYARSICSEIHSEFPNLKKDWPMNCNASYKLKPTELLLNEIARIDAIWSCCRKRFGENGNYLFGRFSIADCMFVPMAICFECYGAELCSEANSYKQTLLENPFTQKWLELAKLEEKHLSLAYSNSA